MTESSPYRCPACGFGVFNRRYPKCERCAAPLPAALLYSPEEIERLDAEAAASAERTAANARTEPARDADDEAATLAVLAAAILPATIVGGS
jgi:hypothetical protein